MPFDGTARCKGSAPVDGLISFFDGGQNWCQHAHTRKGRRCLVQAMSADGNGSRTTARCYTSCAPQECGSPYRVLIDFNDHCRGYAATPRWSAFNAALADRRPTIGIPLAWDRNLAAVALKTETFATNGRLTRSCFCATIETL